MASRAAASASLRDRVRELVPPLSGALHKGQRGRIGVVGGSLEYTGAPFFAAFAALRCGCDLAHVFCVAEAGNAIKSYSGDLIVHPSLEASEGHWERGVKKVEEWMPALDVLVVGPGLGRDEWVMKAAREIIRLAGARKLPVVLDGDGLWSMRGHDEALLALGERDVLTPNKVEAERLAQQLAGRTMRALVVKKGPTDEIGSSELKCETEGSPRRCGGQGDVLAGTVACFLNWSKDKPLADRDALVWGACDLVRESSRAAFGVAFRGMVTTDLLAQLPSTMQKLYPV